MHGVKRPALLDFGERRGDDVGTDYGYEQGCREEERAAATTSRCDADRRARVDRRDAGIVTHALTWSAQARAGAMRASELEVVPSNSSGSRQAAREQTRSRIEQRVYRRKPQSEVQADGGAGRRGLRAIRASARRELLAAEADDELDRHAATNQPVQRRHARRTGLPCSASPGSPSR